MWSWLKGLNKQHTMPEEMRKEVIKTRQSEKGYKAISKAVRLQRTKVRAIISKWRKPGAAVNLSRSGQPSKIPPRAQWLFIEEVT